VHRAEAQSAQRKNFAKNAQFFGIALQGRKADLACKTRSPNGERPSASEDRFFLFAVQCRRSLHFWQNFFSACSAPLRDYRAKGILVAAGRAASSRLRVFALNFNCMVTAKLERFSARRGGPFLSFFAKRTHF
jgi:hypothetical protein